MQQPQQLIIQRSPQTINQVQVVQQTTPQLTNTTQQIVVSNSLAQMLAQGKVQMANVNGQQVLIKPIGNNQWHIVAHFKTQADGTLHIVPANNQASESSSTQQVQQQSKPGELIEF